MVKQVAGNIAVALVTALTLSVVDHPGRGREALHGLDSAIGRWDRDVHAVMFVVAAVMLCLSVVLFITDARQRSFDGRTFWEFELRMPSWSTTSVGCGVFALLLWWGGSVCANGSAWGLVPIAVAGWIGFRFGARLRRGWTSQFELL